MPRLIFIDPAQNEHVVDAVSGQSLMQAATSALVPGIEASCGGNCVCATCHAYIDNGFLSKLRAPDETERAMLECTNDPQPNSRLTCQIAVTDDLDGMRVHVAPSQH